MDTPEAINWTQGFRFDISKGYEVLNPKVHSKGRLRNKRRHGQQFLKLYLIFQL